MLKRTIVVILIAFAIGTPLLIKAKQQAAAQTASTNTGPLRHDIAKLQSGDFLQMKTDQTKPGKIFRFYWVKNQVVTYVVCLGCTPQKAPIEELSKKVAQTITATDWDYTSASAQYAKQTKKDE